MLTVVKTQSAYPLYKKLAHIQVLHDHIVSWCACRPIAKGFTHVNNTIIVLLIYSNLVAGVSVYTKVPLLLNSLYTVMMMSCELRVAPDPRRVVKYDVLGIPCVPLFRVYGPFGLRVLSCLSQPRPWLALVHFVESRWVGGDVCVVDPCGKTILDYVIMYGNLEIAMRLAGRMRLTCTVAWWDHGVIRRLFLAAERCVVGVMKWLIAGEPTPPNVCCRDPTGAGRTLLHCAVTTASVCVGGRPSVAQMAIDTRRVGMCDLLYEPGVGALSLQDCLGYSVASRVVESGSSALLDWLVCKRLDCDFRVQTSDGRTLLHLAVASGSVRTLTWLLDNTQNDPTDRDNDGRTALHDAVLNMDVEMCHVLTSRPGCSDLLGGLSAVTDRCVLLDAVFANDLPMVLLLRDYYVQQGHIDTFNRSDLFTAAAQYDQSGLDVLHWLCVNYPPHTDLMSGVARLHDRVVSVRTRVVCCYYDPSSSGGDRVCMDKKGPMGPGACLIGPSAIELEGRLSSWRHGTTDWLRCFVPIACMQDIILDYAICVDQFLPQ